MTIWLQMQLSLLQSAQVPVTVQGFFSSSPYALRTAVICALALIVLVFGMYGIGFDAQAFIYSKF